MKKLPAKCHKKGDIVELDSIKYFKLYGIWNFLYKKFTFISLRKKDVEFKYDLDSCDTKKTAIVSFLIPVDVNSLEQ
jgi:hypothetical protein